MVQLEIRIQAERQNVESALDHLDEALARKPRTMVELAAIGTFLHNFYGGVENIAKQVLLEHEKKVPMSGSWHKDLLEATVDEGILTRALADELYEYLAFRHFFVHGYGHTLREKELEPLSKSARKVWKKFLGEISSTTNV